MKSKVELANLGLAEKEADKVMLLESEMLKAAVKFQFRKKDNSIRTANGTLVKEKMIQEDGSIWRPIGEARPELVNIIRFWDLDARAWRCFDITRLIKVEAGI